MTLFNKKKMEHIKSQVGSKIGAQTKLNNYEYGREKAKKIAVGRNINRRKMDNKDELN